MLKRKLPVLATTAKPLSLSEYWYSCQVIASCLAVVGKLAKCAFGQYITLSVSQISNKECGAIWQARVKNSIENGSGLCPIDNISVGVHLGFGW